MGKIIPFIFVFLLATISYASAEIVITEVMHAPISTDAPFTQCLEPDCEWIEIYNPGAAAVSLDAYSLEIVFNNGQAEQYSKTDTQVFKGITIQPKEVIVVAADVNDKNSNMSLSFTNSSGQTETYELVFINDNTVSFERFWGDNSGSWGDHSSESFRVLEGGFERKPAQDKGSILENDPAIPGRQRITAGTHESISSTAKLNLWKAPSVLADSITIDPAKGTNGRSYEKIDPLGNTNQENFRTGGLKGTPGSINRVPQFTSTIPPIELTALVKDDENNAPIFSAITTSNLVTCQISQNLPSQYLNCTLGKDLFGEANVTVKVTDASNQGLSESEKTFKLKVLAVNDPPVFTSQPSTQTLFGTEFIYTLQATDVDNPSAVLYKLIKGPVGMTLTGNILKWTPTQNDRGTHNIILEAKDQGNAVNKVSNQDFDLEVLDYIIYENIDVTIDGVTVQDVNRSQEISAKPGSTVSVSYQLQNNNQARTLEKVNTTHVLEGEQPVTTTLGNIPPQSSITRSLTFVIPINAVGKKSFTLNTLATENVAVNNQLQQRIAEASTGFFFAINKDVHDVTITEATMLKENGKQFCSREQTAKVTLLNRGLITENMNAALTSTVLGINHTEQFILDPGQQREIVVSFTAPEYATTTNIQVDASYFNQQILIFIPFDTQNCQPLKEDFDNNMCVEDKDFELLQKVFGLTKDKPGFDEKFDLNKDNIIDFKDFITFAKADGKGFCSQPPVTPPTDGGTTPPAQPTLTILDKTSIALTSQEDKKVSTTLKITNTDNFQQQYTITFPKFTKDQTSITFTAIDAFTLVANQSKTVVIEADIDENMPVGKYTDNMHIKKGTTDIVIPTTIEVTPALCELGVQGNLRVTIEEPDKGDDLAPGQEVEIKVNVRNNNKEDKDVIVEAFLWNMNENQEIIDLESDATDVEEGKDEDFTLTFTMPTDESDLGSSDNLILYVKAYEDGEEGTQCNQISEELNGKRENTDIQITRFAASKSIVQCSESVNFQIDVENAGKREDKDVTISLLNTDLELSMVSESFTLNKFDKSDNAASKTFSFRVPEDAEEQEYTIQATVEGTTKTAPLTVRNCEESKEATSTPDIFQQGSDTQTTGTGQSGIQPGQSSSSLSSNKFLAILAGIIAGILIIVMIIYGIQVRTKNKYY